MQKITLYRYEREAGHITVSPVMPTDKEYTTMLRLVAEDGMELVNGDIRTICIDVETDEGWTEELVEEEEDK